MHLALAPAPATRRQEDKKFASHECDAAIVTTATSPCRERPLKRTIAVELAGYGGYPLVHASILSFSRGTSLSSMHSAALVHPPLQVSRLAVFRRQAARVYGSLPCVRWLLCATYPGVPFVVKPQLEEYVASAPRGERGEREESRIESVDLRLP